MPAVVTDNELGRWLEGGQAEEVLGPADIKFAIAKMDPAMNNPRVQVREC
jgi:hypothetical protein